MRHVGGLVIVLHACFNEVLTWFVAGERRKPAAGPGSTAGGTAEGTAGGTAGGRAGPGAGSQPWQAVLGLGRLAAGTSLEEG